jgi:hypothetical protein
MSMYLESMAILAVSGLGILLVAPLYVRLLLVARRQAVTFRLLTLFAVLALVSLAIVGPFFALFSVEELRLFTRSGWGPFLWMLAWYVGAFAPAIWLIRGRLRELRAAGMIK